jgi:RES domain-containing protein
MIVYRIGRPIWARDLSGEGARLYGGRWNPPGVPCLYASESRALALLEFTANVSPDAFPGALAITEIDIPEVEVMKPTLRQLPGHWRNYPAPDATRAFGERLLRQAEALVIRMPSVIIPEEYNFLVNPLHPEARSVRVLRVKEFKMDGRLKGR